MLGTAIGAKSVPTYSSTFKTDFKGEISENITLKSRGGILKVGVFDDILFI